MHAQNLTPHPRIAAYVGRILVIENKSLPAPFMLPLYANGVPTLLYTSAKGTVRACATNHLTLFGQTISPESFPLTDDFDLVSLNFFVFTKQLHT